MDSGIHDTAVLRTAVSMTLLYQYNTAKPRNLKFERLWLPLKGKSIKNILRQIALHYIYNMHTKNIGVIYG
jgi:hypothetical protein